MDMHVATPLHRVGVYYTTTGTEYARLAEHRRQAGWIPLALAVGFRPLSQGQAQANCGAAF